MAKILGTFQRSTVQTTEEKKPLLESQATPSRGSTPAEEDETGLASAFLWVLVASVLFAASGQAVRSQLALSSETEAAVLLYHEVPKLFYFVSAAAFFSAFVQNCCALIYEAGSTKKQLALVSCFIKGLSAYVDLLLATGNGAIILDYAGNPLVISRYTQWMVTTPTLIYVVSKISDFTRTQVATVVLCQFSVILTGLLSSVAPSPWKWLWMLYCMVAYCYVIYSMGKMLQSAITESADASQRQGLLFIYYGTVIIWSSFAVVWFGQELGMLSIYRAELGNMLSNFSAKVLFSSSVMYGNFVTIAQRRALAKEAQEHKDRLKQIEDLKVSMQAKEEFLSMVSHELRTPLNGIIGLSEAMLRGGSWQLGEKGTHYIKTIKNSSHHLANIINDILDAAAFSKGRLVIKREKVRMTVVLDHVLDTVQHLLKKKVALERAVDPDTPDIIADGSRIVQIIFNLVGNALKFTTEGYIRVTVKPLPAAGIGMDMVQLSVEDTGCGIARDKQKLIFEAFGQGDMSATRKFGGTGLGLNITKSLIEAHGGSITVESVKGKGSTFSVRLPVNPSTPKVSSECARDNGQSMGSNSPRATAEDVLFTPLKGRSAPNSLEEARAGEGQASQTAALKVTAAAMVPKRSGVTSTPINPVDRVSMEGGPGPVVPGQAPAVSYRLVKFDSSSPGMPGDTPGRFMLSGESATASTNLFQTASLAKSKKHLPKRAASRIQTKTTQPGAPCSMKDGSCLTDRKSTHMEAHGSTLILTVDDEPTNHLVIEEIVSSQGYKVHSELDARDALKWVEDSPVLPDLILLDCMMPEMSGQEFCVELRKTVPDAVVPVIMISAKTDEENIVKGLSHGCNDFICKPVKQGELLARISAQLRVKADATWVQSIVKGVLEDDSEAMNILQTILPEPIISRIQEGQHVIGDAYDHVVIMFSDIVGFSTMSSTMSAVEVFLMLTNLYYAFDRLVDKYGVYKVETIGDGYMIAAGHDEDTAKAALGTPLERIMKMGAAMLEAVRAFKPPSPDGKKFEIRLGVHCGPAYAGVIGMKCPRYCFLGDTVNVASRMESNSFPSCMHVSDAVVKGLQSQADNFAPLGERAIKGKGKMVTHLFKVGDWQEALEKYNASREEAAALANSQAVVMENRAMSLAEGGLGLRKALSPQATRNLIRSGSKRAEALEVLTAQVAELQNTLQSERGQKEISAARVREVEVQLGTAQNSLKSERLLLQQVQQEMNLVKSQPLKSSLEVIGAQVKLEAASIGPATTAPALPGCSVRSLLQDMGLQEYVHKFESEHVKLHMLLGVDHRGLEALGIHSYGHREQLIEGVKEYLRAYLRAAETTTHISAKY
ncbi:hypothetical protein WJX77_010729 [Trebouxia sp. C0004]